jgi:hypothetical protein
MPVHAHDGCINHPRRAVVNGGQCFRNLVPKFQPVALQRPVSEPADALNLLSIFGGHGFMPYPALRLAYRSFFQFSLAQKWRGPDEVVRASDKHRNSALVPLGKCFNER